MTKLWKDFLKNVVFQQELGEWLRANKIGLEKSLSDKHRYQQQRLANLNEYTILSFVRPEIQIH